MRLSDQLGGEEPEPEDREVEALLADWRRAKEEGADPLSCPDCGVTTNDGERCGECLSYLAGFYIPEGD